MKKIYWPTILLTIFLSANGQGSINSAHKLAPVLHEDRDKNLIRIPNMGKFYLFKIYHNQKTEPEYIFVTEKRKPRLPKGNNSFPYEVKLEDTECHSREIDYKIIAFDKRGHKICEMKIIWDEEKL